MKIFSIVAILPAIDERSLHFDTHVCSRPILIISFHVRLDFTVGSILEFSAPNSAALRFYHTFRLMHSFWLVVPKGVRWRIGLHFYGNVIKNFLESFITSYPLKSNHLPWHLIVRILLLSEKNIYLCNQANILSQYAPLRKFIYSIYELEQIPKLHSWRK